MDQQRPPFTTAQAADLGYRPQDLTDAVRAGELLRPFRGVYLPAGTELTVPLRARLLGLVTPADAVLADRTAAWVRGCDLSDFNAPTPTAPIDTLVARGRSPIRRPGVRSRSAELPAGDVEPIEGVLVTTPARTAADLARLAREGWGLAAVDSFLRSGTTTREAIAEILARYPGDRGVARGRDNAEWGDAGAESVMESWSRWRLLIVGLPRPRTQVPLMTAAGPVRIDMGYEDLQTGVEYDGDEFHDHRVGGPDHRRLLGIAGEGWRISVLGSAQVLGRRPTAALEVSTQMMMRGWHPDDRTQRNLEELARRCRWDGA
jgi:hypothetical protein